MLHGYKATTAAHACQEIRRGSPILSDRDFHSTPQLSQIARWLFAESPLVPRLIQSLRPYICPFAELLPWVPTGSSILDIGCGSGLFLGLLVSTGARIEGTGVDIGADAINRARKMSHKLADFHRESRLEFQCLEANAPFADRTFDLVSLIDVVHHVPTLRQRSFLEDACACVSRGGLLLYKDMCRKPHWRASANRLHDLVMVGESIHYFPIEEVEALASRAEFQLVASRECTRLWYGHEFRLFRAS